MVVIIIGVFAAMAMPAITNQLRDRRVHETAQRVAMTYQQARVRAMGQGGAILVHFDPGANGQGLFETREALVGGSDVNQACKAMPSPSCTHTDWYSSGSGQFRSIETLDLGKQYGLDNVYATLTPDPASTKSSKTYMDVCFTPMGRTFVGYAPSSLAPLAAVPEFDVFRGNGDVTQPVGLIRHVLVLPTGIARLLQ